MSTETNAKSFETNVTPLDSKVFYFDKISGMPIYGTFIGYVPARAHPYDEQYVWVAVPMQLNKLDPKTKMIDRRKIWVNELYVVEEKKMQKTYIGMETIEALKQGKILQDGPWMYKQGNDGSILAAPVTHGDEWTLSKSPINKFLARTFVEYVPTIQAGDWVKSKRNQDWGDKVVRITESISGKTTYAEFENGVRKNILDLELANPHEIGTLKKRKVFINAGRMPFEYKPGDLVTHKSYTYLVMVVNDHTLQLHQLNTTIKDAHVDKHNVTPLYFVESKAKIED